MMLTGKTRYRRFEHGLLLEVEVHDKPKLVKIGKSYAVEQRTKWRDADERDLQELQEIHLLEAVNKAYNAGAVDAVTVPPKAEQH